jgi:SAM-dependent methyltransferase
MSARGPAESTSTAPHDANYGRDYYRRELHQDHWFRDNRRKKAMRWQAILRMSQPAPGDVVLDLGCAAGEHSLRLAPLVRQVIGVDSSPDAIALAVERAQDAPNVTFVRADATRLAEVADASIDKAIAIDFVEHVDDDALARMLDACWRVLRPGGTLAVYTPCATHYVERMKKRDLLLKQIPGHIAVRTPGQFERLLRAHPWRIADRFYLPSTYPLFGALDRAFAALPRIGPWFRFRYCVALARSEGP